MSSLCCDPDTDAEAATELALDLAAAAGGAGLGGKAGVTLSFGVAALGDHDATAAELMARADVELYRAKRTRDSVWADGRRRHAQRAVA